MKKHTLRKCSTIMVVACVISFGLLAFGAYAQPAGAQAQGNLPMKEVAPLSAGGTEVSTGGVSGQSGRKKFSAKPIVVETIEDPLEERLSRHITLDVREMNVVDVLKFLSLKGDFNMVIGDKVKGRVTLYLKDVQLSDALDILVISNQLAYHVETEILHIMTETEYQAVFGKKFNDKNIVEIVHLKYAKPSYVLAALDQMKSDLGKVIIDEDTGSVVMIDTPQSIADMKKSIGEMEASLEFVVYPLQYAKADVVAEKLKSRIDAQAVGTITFDERTNKVFIRALPGRRVEIEMVLKSLDTPTKEVLVEARVLQIAFNPKMDFGIDWNLDFRNSGYQALRRMSFNNIFMNENTLSTSSNLLSNYAKFAVGDFDVNKFDLAIRALKQVSDTKILSNPKILVTNNQEAVIHIGDTVPYIISTTSGTGDNAITSEDVRFVDVGLKLNVTPTINDDGYVTMLLKPEISNVTTRITSQGGGIPQVNKTLVETTVMVKDGSTVILGGLKKDNKNLTKKGIPLLMDMPFVGKLFGATSESIESTEIVIFITPHIIKGDEGPFKYKGEPKLDQDYHSDNISKQPAKTLTIKR